MIDEIVVISTLPTDRQAKGLPRLRGEIPSSIRVTKLFVGFLTG